MIEEIIQIVVSGSGDSSQDKAGYALDYLIAIVTILAFTGPIIGYFGGRALINQQVRKIVEESIKQVTRERHIEISKPIIQAHLNVLHCGTRLIRVFERQIRFRKGFSDTLSDERFADAVQVFVSNVIDGLQAASIGSDLDGYLVLLEEYKTREQPGENASILHACQDEFRDFLKAIIEVQYYLVEEIDKLSRQELTYYDKNFAKVKELHRKFAALRF